MEKSEQISVNEASSILGISPATVKNWIKLGKIKGTKKGASFWLEKSDVKAALLSLDTSDALRSRRNKSRQTTNFIPKSYIPNSSPNYKTIKSLICDRDISKYSTNSILYSYSAQIMENAGLSKDIISALQTALTNSKEGIDVVSSITNKYPLTYIPEEDTLGMLYLSLRGLQDKKSTGAYYTPYFVVDELITKALDTLNDGDILHKSYLDPSCGTGNFLIRLPKEIPLSSIHGCDIDEIAISLARINLAIKYQIHTERELSILMQNVSAQDFILGDSSFNKSFNVVLGNPPWGYVFTKEETGIIKKNYSCFDGSGKPESFSLFLEKSLGISNQVTFLLPETILESDYHYGIREFILSCSHVDSIIYLGEVFDKVQCPSIIMSVAKYSVGRMITSSFYKKSSKLQNKLTLIRSFQVPGSRICVENMHILADKNQFAIIEKMRSIPHFTLKGNADFALGIVTGSNSSVLTDKPVEGSEPIIKGKDISKYRISIGNSYTIFDESKYQQVAPEKFYRAKDKLFYKFIAGEPVIAMDTEGLLSLNSANIIIPHIAGYSSAYIMAILNSEAISFYYRHTCKNMKVLRSVLEELPIPVCDKETRSEISSLAMEIQSANNNGLEPDNNVVKRLDYSINRLYNLYSNEVKIIESL
ncbi:TaqI-like C-terminal specificity domain-containing protein [Butyrivibrio sp. VCB2006]|uniref:TaqI-like C-terminal specificity domain-containing protein n=1 Tax=Butyrivibrio sp. VCB2006 TaxID=1280679 RepID=UPI000411D2A9|nr:TaqI-like C-terminal specificity domain-containing protein [Butyrivibrio sp. VCB2006]